MSISCKRHLKTPYRGYCPCAACELEHKDSEIEHLKAEVERLKKEPFCTGCKTNAHRCFGCVEGSLREEVKP